MHMVYSILHLLDCKLLFNISHQLFHVNFIACCLAMPTLLEPETNLDTLIVIAIPFKESDIVTSQSMES